MRKTTTIMISICMMGLLLISGTALGDPIDGVVVDADGNVGIGTNDPKNKLHIHENSGDAVGIHVTNTDTNDHTDIDFDGGHIKFRGSDEAFCIINREPTPMLFLTDDVQRMQIDSNGNVGIGSTHAPRGKLDVHINSSTESAMTISQGAGAGDAIKVKDGSSPTANDLFVIKGSGNVGIGKSPTYGRLTVYRDDTMVGWPNLFLEQNGTGDATIKWGVTDSNTWTMGLDNDDDDKLKIGYYNANDAGVNGNTKLTIQRNGYVGIGKPNPSYLLDVNGPIRVDTTVYNSDRRWKKDINTIDSSLDRVCQLRGVNYQWKDEEKGEGLQLGVIAQEVEEVFPEVVMTDSEGYKSVSYGKLVAPLIEAVKELKAENEELKKRLLALEEKM